MSEAILLRPTSSRCRTSPEHIAVSRCSLLRLYELCLAPACRPRNAMPVYSMCNNSLYVIIIISGSCAPLTSLISLMGSLWSSFGRSHSPTKPDLYLIPVPIEQGLLAYDHLLTFQAEIQLLWGKPFSRVTVLFILIRYCTLFSKVLHLSRTLRLCIANNPSVRIEFRHIFVSSIMRLGPGLPLGTQPYSRLCPPLC